MTIQITHSISTILDSILGVASVSFSPSFYQHCVLCHYKYTLAFLQYDYFWDVRILKILVSLGSIFSLAKQTITTTSVVTKTISNNLWIPLKPGNKTSHFIGKKTAIIKSFFEYDLYYPQSLTPISPKQKVL